MTQTNDSMSFENQLHMQTSVKKISIADRVHVLKYRFWLILLREVSLIKTLSENLEKVPKRTFSYLLAKLFHDYSRPKRLLLKVEQKLRSNIY